MTTYQSEIVLGHEYRVKILKLRGIADSVHFFRNACERVVLQYMHDGDLKEASFDAVDLEDVTPVEEKRDEPEFVVPKSGGPARTMPKRR